MALLHAIDSGVGPDGIPYSGYLATIDISASIFGEFCAFVPKKVPPGSPVVVSVPVPLTRPLGLQNTDCKVCSAAVHFAAAPVASAFCSPVQSGFLKGRDFL
eukprot:1256273-Karenia_brevis.AAC.1